MRQRGTKIADMSETMDLNYTKNVTKFTDSEKSASEYLHPLVFAASNISTGQADQKVKDLTITLFSMIKTLR